MSERTLPSEAKVCVNPGCGRAGEVEMDDGEWECGACIRSRLSPSNVALTPGTKAIPTSNEDAFRALLLEWMRACPNPPEWHWSFDLHVRTVNTLGARPTNETKACVWEDCDQEAIYCAGHAREFVRGEPVKAADPKMVPCTACGNKPIDAQHCDVCYPPGACEWCATGIPRSTDGRRHESDMGVWACRSPAPKASEQPSPVDDAEFGTAEWRAANPESDGGPRG